ncbi:MAG: IMPACT family protein [Micrococcales bacterium]|nr:IMPACT family protein [Micrococcales bacterium]
MDGVAFVYLAKPVTHELIVKRSRFVTTLQPVGTETEARQAIAQIAKLHHAANHNCSAMVIGSDGGLQRSNDDGEPSGTAGLPMLEVLRRRAVTDVVAVVTRYFGGTLLGAHGLVRAYSGAVAETLDMAALVRKVWLEIVHLEVDAGAAGREEAHVRSLVGASSGIDLVKVTYGAEATFELALTPVGRAALDQALASGRIRARLVAAGWRLTTIR